MGARLGASTRTPNRPTHDRTPCLSSHHAPLSFQQQWSRGSASRESCGWHLGPAFDSGESGFNPGGGEKRQAANAIGFGSNQRPFPSADDRSADHTFARIGAGSDGTRWAGDASPQCLHQTRARKLLTIRPHDKPCNRARNQIFACGPREPRSIAVNESYNRLELLSSQHANEHETVLSHWLGRWENEGGTWLSPNHSTEINS